MTSLKTTFTRVSLASLLVCSLGSSAALGAKAYPVFTDLNAEGLAFGSTDVFNNSSFYSLDETGNFMGNDILVTTLVGPGDNNGYGITVPISNGENGITSTDFGANIDIDNIEPVNAAIAEVNGGGKLSNGNIIRASVWMRSDPNDPAVGAAGTGTMPQVEGVLKIELWKEALSTEADFEGPGDSDYGDRIWDQDQQGAAGSFVDINGDGTSGGFGAPTTVSLSTESWTQMVVEYEVDDTPADFGHTTFPWEIGIEAFTVADVEDIRAVFFAGDYAGTDFTNGGSWWTDNLLIEVFADQAEADSTDPLLSNPAPVEVVGIPGDFDMDEDVDGADFLLWQRDGLGAAELDEWRTAYGTGSLAASVGTVPEPASALLLMLGALAIGCMKQRSR